MKPLFVCDNGATDSEPSRVMHAGWLNVLGQFAATAGCGYLTAQHLGQMLELSSGREVTQQDTFLIYASEVSTRASAKSRSGINVT